MTDTPTPEPHAPGGPVAQMLRDRPPVGPMARLEHDELAAVQRDVLASPRRDYSVASRALFRVMDEVYGPERTLEKFRVLELVARVPYQAWESVAYVAMTHTSKRPGFARRVYDRARVARIEQDNEQWHLLILEELTKDEPRHWLRGRVIPQILAVVYYQLSWILFVVHPRSSYRLNADFEDHAAHEYAALVEETPRFEHEPFRSDFEADYGAFDNVADLFRQICHDEVLHREESETMMSRARYG
ncbi:MAG: alternative oxidase [Acidimicrobiales bacterium]